LLLTKDSHKIAGFTDRRVWGLDGRDATPELEDFLEAAFKHEGVEQVEKAIGEVVKRVKVLGGN
jgi:hypothetical protein